MGSGLLQETVMELAWLECGWDGDHADPASAPCTSWLGWGTTTLPINPTITLTTTLNIA